MMNTKPMQWLRVIVLIGALAGAAIGLIQSPAHVTQAQGGSAITYGDAVFGTLNAGAVPVGYMFNGAAGDLVQVAVKATTGTLNPGVDLIGPAQQVIAAGHYNRLAMRGNDAHLSVFLPESGAYTIAVSALDGSAGDYVLRLQGRGVVVSTSLEYDVPVTVNVLENSPPQYYTFTAGDCPTTLIVTDRSGGEPFTFPFVAHVRDQAGTTVAVLSGGSAQEDRVTVPAHSGTYEVEVFAADPALAGLIELLITCAENAPGCGADAGVTATSGGAACPPCPTCYPPFTPGSSGTCPDMNFTILAHATVVDGAILTWNAVPGADAYQIHIYGYAGEEEHYFGAAGAPGDATEFVFEHLWPEFTTYRFVIEALQAGEPICSDEGVIEFENIVIPACPVLALSAALVDVSTDTVEWTWGAMPDVAGYVLHIVAVYPDDTTALYTNIMLPPEITTWTTTLPDMGTVTFRGTVSLIVDDLLICPAETVITLIPTVTTCENWGPGGVAVDPEGILYATWPAFPDAAGYYFYIMDESGAMLPGFPVVLPPEQTWYNAPGLPPGNYTVGVGIWTADQQAICVREYLATIGGGTDVPCEVHAEQGGVQVHVGPGRLRGVFDLMLAGNTYRVIGQALDADGNVWWQLDKTQWPGSEVTESLWVAEADVIETGNCTDIPQAEIPEFVPECPGCVPGGEEGGTWGDCGSCDTCGHPGECLTTPEGECVWDPATCHYEPPGEGPGTTTCYTLQAVADPPTSGSGNVVNILTPTNCSTDGGAAGYTPGTVVQVSAVPYPKFRFSNWTGCGAGGSSSNPIASTMNNSCTITGHFVQ